MHKLCSQNTKKKGRYQHRYIRNKKKRASKLYSKNKSIMYRLNKNRRLAIIISFFSVLVAVVVAAAEEGTNITATASTATSTVTDPLVEDNACGVDYYNFGGSIDDCQSGNFNFDVDETTTATDTDGHSHYHLSIIADGVCRKSGVGLGYHRAYCSGDGGIFFTQVHCKNSDCTDCGPRKNGLLCTNQDYPKSMETYVEGYCNIQTCDDPNSVTKDKTIVFAIEGTCNPNACPKYNIIPEAGNDISGDEEVDGDDDDDEPSFTTTEIVVLIVLVVVALGCCFGCRYMCCTSSSNKQNNMERSAVVVSSTSAAAACPADVVVSTGGDGKTGTATSSSSSETGSTTNSSTSAEV